MEAIWNYLSSSPILVIVLVIVVALIFSRLGSIGKGAVAPEDLVPHYKRFERRESELGNRRQGRGPTETPEDRRKFGRRATDWLRRKR